MLKMGMGEIFCNHDQSRHHLFPGVETLKNCSSTLFVSIVSMFSHHVLFSLPRMVSICGPRYLSTAVYVKPKV